MAELVYQQGFSAVCVSSTFNFEFMENASTAEVPAYMPVDVHDLHVALTEIDHRLEKLYPERLGPRALMGYSMGAFESLFLAATQSTNQPPLLKFDRYVAIDPPVRLVYGISKLDEYFQAPLAWPAAERADDLENTFLKVAALSKQLAHAPNGITLQRHRVQVSHRHELPAHPARRHLTAASSETTGNSWNTRSANRGAHPCIRKSFNTPTRITSRSS